MAALKFDLLTELFRLLHGVKKIYSLCSLFSRSLDKGFFSAILKAGLFIREVKQVKSVKVFVLFCLVPLLSALPSVTAPAVHHSNGPDRREAKETSKIVTEKKKPVEFGKASWYGPHFFGNLKANGKKYRRTDFHIAHKTLPLGSHVRVTNLTNKKSVVTVVQDRGPYKYGRIIDASRKVAEALDFTEDGTAPVKVEIISMR